METRVNNCVKGIKDLVIIINVYYNSDNNYQTISVLRGERWGTVAHLTVRDKGLR